MNKVNTRLYIGFLWVNTNRNLLIQWIKQVVSNNLVPNLSKTNQKLIKKIKNIVIIIKSKLVFHIVKNFAKYTSNKRSDVSYF